MASRKPPMNPGGTDGSATPEVPTSARLRNLLWCACNHCIPMGEAIECLCCQEIPEIRRRLRRHQCVTLTRKFKAVCLDRAVLEVVLKQRRRRLPPAGDLDSRNRKRATPVASTTKRIKAVGPRPTASPGETWSLIKLREDNLDELRTQKHNSDVYDHIAAQLEYHSLRPKYTQRSQTWAKYSDKKCMDHVRLFFFLYIYMSECDFCRVNVVLFPLNNCMCRKYQPERTTGLLPADWPYLEAIRTFSGSLPVNDPSHMEEDGTESCGTVEQARVFFHSA
ncbi:uncharacterized protein LOC144170890 [Haemaphysalis longicornis]